METTPITLQHTVETFMRLVRQEVLSTAVLVSADDLFEISKTPSLVLQGPVMSENHIRRAMVNYCDIDLPNETFTEALAPRLYHLDFEVIATGPKLADVLNLQEALSRFLSSYTTLDLGEWGRLNLTEVTPLGGGRRVNLSNLRQATGLVRIEDFPVWSADTFTGGLILERKFNYREMEKPDDTIDDTSYTDADETRVVFLGGTDVVGVLVHTAAA